MPREIPMVWHGGHSVTLRELAAEAGMSYDLVRNRWKKGDRADLLTRPVDRGGHFGKQLDAAMARKGVPRSPLGQLLARRWERKRGAMP